MDTQSNVLVSGLHDGMGLVEAFEKRIRPNTVLVHWRDAKRQAWGTGTVVAAVDGGALVVTARHVVLGHAGRKVTWRVTRGFGREDTPRTVEFTSDSNLRTGRSDAGFRIHEDDTYDVAQILVPATCVDGEQQFTDSDHSALPFFEPQFFLSAI